MGRFAHVIHLRLNHKELAALRRMAAIRGCSVEEVIRLELRLTDGDLYEPAPPPASVELELAPPKLRIIEGGGESHGAVARPEAQDA